MKTYPLPSVYLFRKLIFQQHNRYLNASSIKAKMNYATISKLLTEYNGASWNSLIMYPISVVFSVYPMSQWVRTG